MLCKRSQVPRKQPTLRVFLCIAFMLSGVGLDGCRPARPSNVPADSVYVVGAKRGWWQRCSFDPKEDVDYCQIFNEGGNVLWNEAFLPYDGGKAARQSELEILSDTDLAGPQYVCLKNGRILVPKSHFEQLKRDLDWSTGKSKTY